MTTLLIDGNHLAHRCRHVFSLSIRGKDVSVTYGFLRVMTSLIRKFKATSVIVCWDGGIPEFRRKALPEYKAGRHKDDDPLAYEDFIRQITELSDYSLPMAGVVSCRKMGAEADDLLYHASRLCPGSIVVTGDKDLLQAVNGNTKVYSPSKNILYDESTILEEFGVSVADYVHWRAIQGDGSDNITGVYGIGSKTATKLFKEFGTITGIVNAALGINPKGKISGEIGSRIVEFGFKRICDNTLVMALYADRVGAKQAIIDSVDDFMPANKVRLNKYLLNNAFLSLVEDGFVGSVLKLCQPELCLDNIRIPIVCQRRKCA